MMEVCNHVYLILAHQYPDQLKRLVTRLSGAHCRCVVHVDKRVDLEAFHTDLALFVPDRCNTFWGGFGLVQATLNGLQLIADRLPDTDRVTLLSGQDYPIKPLSCINEFFCAHPLSVFISYRRVDEIALENPRIVFRFPQYEKFAAEIELYKGSQWWSFPMEVVRGMLDLLQNNQNFLHYFTYVKIPDESFFHTLLLNAGCPNIVNDDLHCMVWEPPFIHPKTLLCEDVGLIRDHPGLFARKFNEGAEILDIIDQSIVV